jgi:iron complex outermembrane recepter protein
MTTRLNLLACGSVLALLASGAPAFAQSTDDTDTADVNDIIVTANKREENLNDVGLTIAALGREQLAERKIVSLEDVASIVPGLTFTPSTTNTPIFTLRGVGFNESSLGVYPAVSVYIDQIPLSFPILAAHSAYDLERVEVLKGPQGTLFGQNSTGGAINYVAAGGQRFGRLGGDISYGRFNQIDGNAFISGPLGENAGFRIAINGLQADDWQKSYTRDDGNGKQSYIAGRIMFEVKPSETVTLNLSANAWRDKSQPQAQQLIAVHEQVSNAGGPGNPLSAPVFDAQRNYLSPGVGAGVCPTVPAACSAQLNYTFSPFNPRAADWSTMELDPGTATQLGAAGGYGIVIGTASATNFDPKADRKFVQGAFRADVELGNITLTSLTSYTDFKQDMRTDGDGMALVAYDLQSNHGTIKSFNQELRLANDPTSGLRWIVGGNYENSKTLEDQMLRYYANSNHYPNNLYINASGDRLSQKIKNYAVFGNLEFDIGEQLTLKAGARYTSSKIDAINFAYTQEFGNVDPLFNIIGGIGGLPFTPIIFSDSYTLNSTPPAGFLHPDVTINSPTASGIAGLGIPGIPLDATLKQNNVSWRVGLDYKVSSDVLIYANVSRGYKAGSFPALAAAAYISALPVTQESVTAYEAGFKATLAGGVVQLNSAAFYYDYKDKQVRGKLLDPIFGTLDTLVNVPKSRIWGIEGDVTIRPTDGLTVSAAATYLNSKIKEYTGFDIFGGISNTGALFGLPEDLSGNVLPYTPKFSASGNIDYRPNPGGPTPFFGATVNYKSGQDAAIGGGNTTLPTGPRYRIAPGVGLYPYTIDGYATVDARAGYEGEDGKWRVMLWGKNVFNKYYWTAVVPSSDSTARFAGKPATYGVTFGFKFSGDDSPPPPAPVLAPPPPPPAPEPAPPPPPPPVCNKGPYIVFFDWDKADITGEAATILDSAVAAYGNCANIPVMIAGYADRSGSPKYNLGLSERRNASVRGYLSGRGIPDAVISSQGFGEDNNRVPTADGVRELQNRRVEITYGPGSGS